MNRERFEAIAARYASLRIALVGDYFLDRYFLIDPARGEVSIETGLPVHNVVGVRSQPGAAGTVLNNLVALGVGTIHAIGFCGEDGEGFELRRELERLPGVDLSRFVSTTERRTPVYGKPLIVEPGRLPRELSRLDFKNWSATPATVEDQLLDALAGLSTQVDAFVVLEQVDRPETGVTTARVRAWLGQLQAARPNLLVLADSRQGLRHFPPLSYKVNASELARISAGDSGDVRAIGTQAEEVARRTGQFVFVTLAEQGMVGAGHGQQEFTHVPALPVRGPIDVVGAGDSVTAALACALSSGATCEEAMRLAMAAASIVVHQVGTTGTASVEQMRTRLFSEIG